MPSEDDIKELRKRLSILRQTLAYLLEQKAIYGTEAALPLPTRHTLDETRKDIARIKATLRAWGEHVEDVPDDSASTQQRKAQPPPPPPPSSSVAVASCDLGALRVHLSPLASSTLVEFENLGSDVLQTIRLTLQSGGGLFIAPTKLNMPVLTSHARERAGTITLGGPRGTAPLTMRLNASYSRAGAALSEHVSGMLPILLS